MKLSIIVPCFNVSGTLSDQLDALSRQTWMQPWELIIVDNGSTDNTIHIAEQYGAKFKNFKIIEASERKGASYARNMGVNAASGESVAFCDADDVVDENWLREIGDALDRYPFVASRLETILLNKGVPRCFGYPQSAHLVSVQLCPVFAIFRRLRIGCKKAYSYNGGWI